MLLLSSFPHPLPDPFTYHVGYTEYNIIFYRTSILRGLNSSQIHTCVTKAVRMVSEMCNRDPRARLQGEIVTRGGAGRDDVIFTLVTRGAERTLSWRQWLDVLVGFVRFTQAYEGVGFGYKVISDDREGETVALGHMDWQQHDFCWRCGGCCFI